MKDILKKCHVLTSIAKVNFYIMKKNMLMHEFTIHHVPNFLVENNSGLSQKLDGSDHSPLIYTNKSYLSYLCFSLERSNIQIYLGPFKKEVISLDNLKHIGYSEKLSQENVEIYINFMNTIPLFTGDETDNLSIMFKTLINNTLDVTPVSFYTDQQEKHNDTESSKFKQYDFVEKNFSIEENLMKFVELGDVEGLKKFSTEHFYLPARNPYDPLRDIKNLNLTINSLCSRAALRGGLSPHLMHSMSHKFAIQIERLKDVQSTSALGATIPIEYARSVEKYTLSHYSQLTQEVIVYIRRHLTEMIGLSNIARELNISKEHISRQFKVETHMTVSFFIQQSKINESLELIKSNHYSFSDIAYLFGFSNPSHFSVTFKKIMGMSPKKYQNECKKNSTHE